jgi:hypothetical protein
MSGAQLLINSLPYLEELERKAVVDEARSFVGTPFKHQAGVKGAGVDCAHLISEVYRVVGLMPAITYPVYGRDWFRHAANEEKYIVEVAKLYFREIAESEAGVGDWMAVKIGRAYAHCAIITEVQNGKPSKGINAWPTKEKVWEVDIQQDTVFSGHLKRYFSPWNRGK